MHHKSFFLAFVLLLLAVGAEAADISASVARKVAESFFLSQGVSPTRAGFDLVLINYDETAPTRSGNLPAYYIFNLPQGGFVIVSSVDGAKPVLGYSLEGCFSLDADMPETLQEWLSTYEADILAWRAGGAVASPEQKSRWDDILSGTRAGTSVSSVDLKTPDWGQGSPFNSKCPLDASNKRSLVGCTAVAFSQLLYFYKFPEKGTGTLPEYTAKGITVPANQLGRTYRYSEMLAKYSGVSYTSAQAKAVAELCFDVADLCQSEFSSTATGASAVSAAAALVTYMNYDKGVMRYSREFSSAAKWKDMLKENIDAGHPLLYTGANVTSGTGHAFLVDGYDSSDRFLINFGWNGTDNGFYELDAFGAYSLSQSCFTGVIPDKGGNKEYNISLGYYKFSSGNEYFGISYNSGTVKPGNTVCFQLGMLRNLSVYDFNGFIRLAVTDKSGKIRAWVKDSISADIPVGSSLAYSKYYCTIPSGITIRQGDVLRAYFRASSDTGWTPVRYDDEDARIIGGMPLHVADYTSLTFVPESSTLKMRTFPGTSYTLKNTGGTSLSSGTLASGTKSLNLSSLSSGTYVLSFTYGGNTFTLNIIL